MKNKPFIYLLLPVALAIWSVIGYKIWKTLSSQEETEQETAPPVRSTSRTKLLTEQLPTLRLNYPDPFLGQRIPTASSAINSTSAFTSSPIKSERAHRLVTTLNVLPASAPAAAPVVVWPAVEYRGLIENRQKGTKIAILSIEGTSYLLQERQTQSNVTIARAYSDSISLLFQKQKKTFPKI